MFRHGNGFAFFLTLKLKIIFIKNAIQNENDSMIENWNQFWFFNENLFSHWKWNEIKTDFCVEFMHECQSETKTKMKMKFILKIDFYIAFTFALNKSLRAQIKLRIGMKA